MHHINNKRFGLAVGTTVVIIYTGCIMVTSFVAAETAVAFFNNLMHAVDVSAIIRKTPMPFTEAVMGAVEWFIIGWLAGASIAAIYNAGDNAARRNVSKEL